MKPKKIFALYKGEENLCDGTIDEIAQKTGKNAKTLQWMTYTTYQSRLIENDNKLRLIRIPDDEESEC